MDLLKKRKLEENGIGALDSELAGPNQTTLEDARKILEPFTHEQLFEIVQSAILRHPDVLEAVRAIADRDVTQRKLFIRGLGWETTTEKLRNLFAAYGELEEAVVILDKATGKSKGYGFITFKHIDGALRALKEPSKKIDGRMTVTQLAAAGMQGGPGGGGPNNDVDVSARKIYVANVPYDMPADRLLQHFAMYGEIEEGPLGFDKATGKSKGFALFVYKTAEAARASLVDPLKNIDGHPLSCKLAIDGKKGKSGPAGLIGAQGQKDGHGNGAGSAIPAGMGGQYGAPSMVPGYTGFSGPSPLRGHSSLGAGVAIGSGGPGLTSVGNQATPSSYGGSGGFNSAFGSPYGIGPQYNAPSSTAYSSLGGAAALGGGAGGAMGQGGAGSGLAGAGGVLSGGGSGLGGIGSGLGSAGRGSSSFYGLPASSNAMASGDYPPQSAHYSLSSSSGYQSQHHPATASSPVPRGPPAASYQGMPPYY